MLDGTTGVFPPPSDLALSEYDVVDIALEPTDGDPNHSGDSIVRGTLS